MTVHTNRMAHKDRLTLKIKTAKILDRVQKFALGEEDHGKQVEMSATELRAAELLLRKVLPDLKATEHTHPEAMKLLEMSRSDAIREIDDIRQEIADLRTTLGESAGTTEVSRTVQ